MLVTVKLSPDGAEALRKQTGGEAGIASAASGLVKAIRDLGVHLAPMHPSTNDPDLRTYFKIEVPDRETADHVAATLSRTPAVEAAFFKPAEEMP